MIYNKSDIKFEEITPKAFENLCYDYLISIGFQSLVWRDGGADNGRDIEAKFSSPNLIRSIKTKWFFECKHYTSGGVPPEHLNSKIAWADAYQPDFFVVFCSSYITNNARTWIDEISLQKKYKIIVIESENLKDKLIQFPQIIERYFSASRYEKIFKDIKDYKIKFNILPSYEFLKEIILNIDFDRLDNNDICFLLFSFYKQYNYFYLRTGYFDEFDATIINRLLEYISKEVNNDILSSFIDYQSDFNSLGGHGFIDEISTLNFNNEYEGTEEIKNVDFQYYDLHLNCTQLSENWKVGNYLLIFYENVAIELFEVENLEIRVIKNFVLEKYKDLSIDLGEEFIEQFESYKNYFKS
ncbi:restriction endonuclease [Chryseobacterium sp. M5]|uniref:restriction endonuclease n=1 Tax=Chryseobacterium sp. M5 TaxID=3379128 RepID=UPI003857CFA9